jgi:hypothetical protein
LQIAFELLMPAIQMILGVVTELINVLGPILGPILENLNGFIGFTFVSAIMVLMSQITLAVSIFYALESVLWAVVAGLQALVPGGKDGTEAIQKSADAANKSKQAWIDYAAAVNTANAALTAMENGDPPTDAHVMNTGSGDAWGRYYAGASGNPLNKPSRSDLNLGSYGAGSGGGGSSAADKTAKNTGRTADSLDEAKIDLKYLRDIATNKAVNRFTTASISLDFTANNNVSSGADVDGITTNFFEKLVEGVNAAQEG